MSLTIWYIVMAAGLIGMIWCAKSQKRVANAKLYAIICLVVVVISAVMALSSYFSDPEMERAMANQKQFDLAKLNKIAEFVNEKYDGKKVVILVHQDMLPSKDATYIRIDPVKELKSFLKKGVTVVETVIIKPPTPEEIKAMGGNPDDMIPDEISRSYQTFNKKFEECKNLHPDAIIDLAGLPSGEEARKVKVWKWSKNDPKLILTQIDEIGVSFPPKALVSEDGVLECVIVGRNDQKFNFLEDEASKDLKEAFDSMYILVTKDNAKQLIKDKALPGLEK